MFRRVFYFRLSTATLPPDLEQLKLLPQPEMGFSVPFK